MSGLEDLYKEIILDHYRSPRHHGELGDRHLFSLMIDDLEYRPQAMIHELVEIVGLAQLRTNLANLLADLLRHTNGHCLALGHESHGHIAPNILQCKLYL